MSIEHLLLLVSTSTTIGTWFGVYLVLRRPQCASLQPVQHGLACAACGGMVASSLAGTGGE